MNFYGGTILNYCVAFGLHRAVAAMMLLARTEGKMTTPFSLVDPNDVEHVACTYTGFAPLHVAVANGLTRMYDFLCELPGLDEVKHLRTNRHIMTRAVEWGPVGQLTPLQLATFLGDERTFQHIMKRRSTVVWAWGPVTQYQVALHGIDLLIMMFMFFPMKRSRFGLLPLIFACSLGNTSGRHGNPLLDFLGSSI